VSPVFPWLLARTISRDRPDILHLHMPNISVTWALLLPGARRLPWVIHWHSDIPATSKSRGIQWFYRLYQPLERRVLAHAQAIIATSPDYLASSEPLRAYREKCHVIPLGLAEHSSPPAPIDDSLPLRLLAIGRLTYYKGFEYLLEALVNCDDAVLDLVGTGDREQSLKKQVIELGLQQRVRLRGPVSEGELEQLIDRCHCLCLPSIERSEAFGLVLLEAMQRGRPAIVTRVKGSGMTWVIDDQISGLHTFKEDASSLAMAINLLTHDRNQLRRLGLAARQTFLERFRIEESARAITSLYKRLA
jgi:rhamnosyl/mannosyltransferase